MALIAIFGLQHSAMARPWFKRIVLARLPAAFERCTFVHAENLALFALILFWQPIPIEIWRTSSPLREVLWAAFAAGWLILFFGAPSFGMSDFVPQTWAWTERSRATIRCDSEAVTSMPNRLSSYRQKRDFTKTAEPTGKAKLARTKYPRFVIQKHAARRLHYDLRLEVDGVFKSWAVTKGPSLDPKDKRLAVETENHPLDYGDFEGTIPEGEYGGGTVMLWDRGFWAPEGDPAQALRKGELRCTLAGEKAARQLGAGPPTS
jgi:DNA ligase D-like protein (predicted 3'-phosphoesterase)